MTFEYICAGIPVAAMVSAAAVVLVKVYFADTRRMTSRIEGKVVRAEQRVTIANDRRRPETIVVVRYVVGGEALEISQVLKGERARQFPAGRAVVVRYNPADPQMAGLLLQ